MGARLCLHHRDFAPGKTIFENIVYSLEMSNSCVIILSKDYAKSEWCRFEAQGIISHNLISFSSLKQFLV